jgi:hypothetical protein
MLKRLSSLSLFVLYVNILVGQLPQSDLILFDFKKVNSEYFITNGRLLNKFNLDNYNNQPSLFNAQNVYFSAAKEGDAQTDIYAIDLLRKKFWQVTDTPDGEYSPTLMPTKRHFSVIVQEDITNTQRLWQFPIDQSNLGSDIFPGITGVGYHCWINREEAAMFIVGSPNKLIIANRNTQEQRTVIEDIGRGMRANKRGLLYFIHKINDDNWIIKRYDPGNNKISTIVSTPGKSEDFELMPDETLIMAVGSELFAFNPDFSTEWIKVGSLESWNIEKITRLSIFGEKLVVVSNK